MFVLTALTPPSYPAKSWSFARWGGGTQACPTPLPAGESVMGSSHLAPRLRAPSRQREQPLEGRVRQAAGLRLPEKSWGAATRSSQPRGRQWPCLLTWDVQKVGASPSLLAGSSNICSIGIR